MESFSGPSSGKKEKTPGCENSKTVYEELRPTLVLLRILGFAPFSVSEKTPKTSGKFVAHNVFLAIFVLSCGYLVITRDEFNVSQSELSIWFYEAIETCRSLHVAFSLLNFLSKRKTSAEIWTRIDDINVNLRKINIDVNFEKSKRNNFLKVVIFLGIFVVFVVGYATTVESSLSFYLQIFFFLPFFYNYSLIFGFCVFAVKLRSKCLLLNNFFRGEIKGYKLKSGPREKFPSNPARSEWKIETMRLVNNVRDFKFIFFQVYETVKNLNALFGFNFLYFFVMYFCSGTLHCFFIIRYLTGATPENLFFMSVLTITMDTFQIIVAVYGAIALQKEVRRTTMLAHKLLAMIKKEDGNLENEVESFAIQLHQCAVNFSAAGFFSIDFTILLQFGIAFVSNAVFFLQIDQINNVKN